MANWLGSLLVKHKIMTLVQAIKFAKKSSCGTSLKEYVIVAGVPLLIGMREEQTRKIQISHEDKAVFVSGLDIR